MVNMPELCVQLPVAFMRSSSTPRSIFDSEREDRELELDLYDLALATTRR